VDLTDSNVVWRKSTFSGEAGCVEVAFLPQTVLVRDSYSPDGPILEFSIHAWRSFISDLQDSQPGRG